MICAIHFLASRSVRSKFLCYKCTMVGRTLEFIRNHPLARGVLTYSILWPTANLIHQSRTSKEKFNYRAAIRYGLVGVTFVLPVYFTWLKVINRVMPGSDWKACVKKVIYRSSKNVFFKGLQQIISITKTNGLGHLRANNVLADRNSCFLWRHEFL